MLKLISALAAGVFALSPLAQAAQPVYHLAAFQQSAPHLSSNSVLVVNTSTGDTLYQKNANARVPIASITKLMTAMVMLDAGLPMDEVLTISDAEIDRLKNTSSRLAVGTSLTRREMLLLALMSSENRASHVLSRYYPGGTQAFVARMNAKARALGMRDTVFYDPTGLDMRNSSTAQDLSRMVRAAYGYPLIRQYSTSTEHDVYGRGGRALHYRNSNALVREGEWNIGLSKTGYIQEAGRCVVMQATVGGQPLVIVLLDANAPSARTNDARTIKTWLEAQPGHWLAG
ncbi:D-alanyl-D-alanine endopeptidase [Crenobacter caeni]|uniref:D-alanyl-D-alanine endopeptidase n=1 Tax=Crenobacter caeni TaxID=2705474 RepID=A0A6B2KNR3_9NEIS|nr:D-alanyl-D-alanine endopeptidase [Crenobacter caeni]NDV11872.1 D-alanyl-D-alanine endopeptidase [Crenobacter caeni]